MRHERNTVLIQVDYTAPIGSQYYSVGGVDIDHAGLVWQAINIPVSIAELTSTETGEIVGQALTFEEAPEALVSQMLAERVMGVPIQVWLATLDDNNIPTLTIPMITGKCDSQAINIGDGIQVTIPIESNMVYWDRPAGGRFTDSEQQALYPGDRYCEYAGEEWTSAWPAKSYHFI